jgi:HK97 family phage major capsid protein
MNEALKEARGKVETLRKQLSTVLDQAGKDLDMSKVTVIEGDSPTKVAYFQALNSELNDWMIKLEPLENENRVLASAKEQLASLGEKADGMRHRVENDGRGPVVPEEKSLGDQILTAWKAAGMQKHHAFEVPDVGLKTVMSTGAGWLPEDLRTGRLVDFATRPIQVIDVIPSGETTQANVVYMEETTFTNAAAEVAESTQATPGTYPEAALALTEKSSPVRKIGVFLPVTDEQLEDVPQMQGYLNNRLPFMVRQRLDGQVLVGNGTAPNLRGYLNVVGIQTQARGTDPGPDAIYKAMVKVRVVGFAQPGIVAIHPTDWQNIRLLRTADGIYIWGNPSEAGVERIWGLPIVQAYALTQGTALVGDFANYSELDMRRGMEVKVSDSHGTYFVEGKQAIRADIRAALVVYRPTAFCTVTGL